MGPIFDAGKIIADLFREDSQIRRGLVVANKNVKKSMRPMLASTQVDKFLFGADLGDRIKQAKALAQTAAELKTPTPAYQ